MQSGKAKRILAIYTKLLRGKLVNKSEEAVEYGVNERSIQRDIDDIRNCLYDCNTADDVIYDRKGKGYRMERNRQSTISGGEALVICKMLLDANMLEKGEALKATDKIIMSCDDKKSQKILSELISADTYNYIGSGEIIFDMVWETAQSIFNTECLDIQYLNAYGEPIMREIAPVSIKFHEKSLYLSAFCGREEKRLYDFSQIKNVAINKKKSNISYFEKNEEAIKTVLFNCYKEDMRRIIELYPTAKIISEENGCFTVEAKVFENENPLQ